MRISSTLFFQTGLNSINAQQSDLMHLFQQIGSGQRMVTPADDPLAAAQAVNISQAQSLNKRFADNREVARRNLSTEENVLNSVTTLLQDVKTRLVEAGNGTLSDADRATLANVLSSARSSMLGFANSTDGSGQYMFSGSQGGTAPFQGGTGTTKYIGDTEQRNVQVDQTRQLAGSDIGSDVFSRSAPGTNSYLSSAAPGNMGTGLASTPTISDAGAANAGSSYVIRFTSDTAYEVDMTDAAGNPVLPVTTGTYTQGVTEALDLPGGVRVKLSGQPMANDTFAVQPAKSADLNVFDTLDAMIQALEQPVGGNEQLTAKFQNSLATAMQRLDVSYNNVLTVRASVGARLNEIDALDANGGLRALNYSSQLSRLEDLDYYTATTQLTLRQSALEAASLAFRKIQGTSLFNMGAN